jgi:hypothetical protein
VQIVGHLVGLDADEGGETRLTAAVICAGENFLQAGKMLARHRMPVLPKGRAASDVVLPQARLRFVNGQRDGRAVGRAEILHGQPLLVHAVAGFVQNAVERLDEIRFVVAGGQPAIARAERGAKRVGGGVNAARLKSNPMASATLRLKACCAATG